VNPREAVVAEALTWQGTPYHHRGRIKGAGVDCGMLLAEIYERTGVMPHVDPGEYPHDWHMHRSEERYLHLVTEHANQIPGPPKPGDIALWRFGRCYSHGALVIQWPVILHAYLPNGRVTLDDAVGNQELASRDVVFFSPWED
jgi:cell wall-associated NlpC family hydrolase